jgi:hypothetical protein
MSINNLPTSLSIMELPAIVTHLFERAQRPLLPEAQGKVGLFVRYLRRKPARGLAVIYHADEVNRSGNHAEQQAQANDPHRSVSLTLDEKALEGASIRFSSAQALITPVEVEPSGVLRVEELGISVQAFPADEGLPTLAASCDTSEHSPVFEALQVAARSQLSDAAWRLVAASAEPVRYKPANRCVIRYLLVLQHGDDEASTLRRLTLFGKVYADAEQAATVQELQGQLYDEQEREGRTQGPMLPRPMGIIRELGLTFNQAVQPPAGEQMRTGTRALRAQIERGRGGEITSIVLPEEELRLTGAALARLHTSAVRPKEGAPRTGAKEAKRARERAGLIAAHNPAHAEETQRLAGQLAARLEALQPDEYRPAHGGFKASQLLFHSHQVFVVDFDGFCLADAALDVGYFLAYLRPSALWYHRSGMREWFEAAKEVFIDAYRQAMLERSVSASSIEGILEHSKLYEAALIFKIATRRVNRLNSPRSKELSAMLNEIAGCL